MIYKKNHRNEYKFIKSVLVDKFSGKRRSDEFTTVKKKSMMFSKET